MKKYGLSKQIRTFVSDGTKFDIRPYTQQQQELYDKVLIDSECSLDASFKHLMKYLQNVSDQKELLMKKKLKQEKIKKSLEKMSNKQKKRRLRMM